MINSKAQIKPFGTVRALINEGQICMYTLWLAKNCLTEVFFAFCISN